MKVLIFSDVHGAQKRLLDILKSHDDAEIIISLGDHELSSHFLKTHQIIAVKGNYPMDVGVGYTHEQMIGNKKVFFTHGHHYWIKSGFDRLLLAMTATGAQVCFHGHTHQIGFTQFSGRTIINPGAVSFARGKEPESYCVVEVKKDQWLIKWYDALKHTVLKTVSL